MLVGMDPTTSSPPPPAVAAADVVVRRGGVTVLDGVGLAVRPGEVVALLGPNGAGKTTFVECLEGYQRPDTGRIDVLGRNPWRAPAAWRARIGAVLQDCRIDSELSVAEIVTMTRGYYPDALTTQDALDLVGLAPLAKRRVSRLSGGERRRLEIALALIGRPDFVVLDEPTTGFDPEARRSLWKVLAGLRRAGTTMLLTTHLLDEVEELADRVVLLVRGRVHRTGTVEELRSTSGLPDRVGCVAPEMDSAPDLPSVLESWRDRDNGRWTFTTNEPGRTVQELQEYANERRIGLVDVTVRSPSFEDVYLDLLAHREEASP
ncbi:ABC transporter ATP-binding protein [Allosalinactinospora lopnorensis]|uniref:ABC transporter ATP-binding protein n=1 Tax=Allosalinactinospora lopnorensis TaxID=1352348 RepID=UPI000A49B42A|nr:ABC transporter ATP-binding protein [Allosalinactinospora lopnorensis]